MKEERIIIGLTGSFGSGCTTISNVLQERGFETISLSLFLKKEAEEKGRDLSTLERKEIRRILQDIGNEKRKKDKGALIKMCLDKINSNPDTNFVIESIKNPGEIEELKKIPNTFVIATDTTFEVRVDRILEEEYEGDLTQFKEDDSREKDEGIDYGQQVQKCVDLADILINNDGENTSPWEKKDFKERIGKYIDLIKNPGSRYPTDMELWINNAYSISLKSECLKRQVGAIIVKEGYLVASGYNNVLEGDRSCKIEYTGKCYRDINRAKVKYCSICKSELNEDLNCKNSGCEYSTLKLDKILDKCRSLHAEENAILQASRLGGLSLQKAVLYTTTYPCKLCANKIISVGIKEVVYVESYPDEDSVKFFARHSNQVKITKFAGVKAAAFYSLFKAQ